MNNIKKIRYSIILIIILLSNCAKQDSTSSDSNATLEIEGTWVTTCYLNDNDSNTWKYRLNTFKVSGTDIENKKEYFSNVNCLSRTITIKEKYHNLTLGEDVTYESGNKGKKFIINVDSFNRILHTESLVNNYNSWVYCGYNNWELEVKKEFTGKTCGNNNPTTYPVRNTTGFNQYSLVGNNLYLGKFSTSNYPDSVQTSPVYVKQ